MTARLETAVFHRSPAGAVVLTLVAVGLSGWALVNSPVFATDLVRVEGLRRLSSEEVLGLSGVEPGDNLLRLSLDQVASGVKRSPWVADATARRDLPTTLVIDVVERRPAGWMEDTTGRALLARDGTVLARAPGGPQRLPALGAWSAPLRPGERIPQPTPALRVAASLGPPVLAQIASASVQDDVVTLALREGGEVLYGPATELEDKAEALASLLEWAQGRGVPVGYIDLRIPSSPAVRAPPGARVPLPPASG
jgi:cell division protein FtsQ